MNFISQNETKCFTTFKNLLRMKIIVDINGQLQIIQLLIKSESVLFSRIT